MIAKQVSLRTNNSAAIGTHQRWQKIVHCISLDRQYRARKWSKFTYAKYCRETWGGPGRPSCPAYGGHAVGNWGFVWHLVAQCSWAVWSPTVHTCLHFSLAQCECSATLTSIMNTKIFSFRLKRGVRPNTLHMLLQTVYIEQFRHKWRTMNNKNKCRWKVFKYILLKITTVSYNSE